MGFHNSGNKIDKEKSNALGEYLETYNPEPYSQLIRKMRRQNYEKAALESFGGLLISFLHHHSLTLYFALDGIRHMDE